MDERDRLKSHFRMLSVNDPYLGNELVDVLDAYLDAKFKRKWQGLTDEEIREFELWLDDEEEKHGWNPPADIVKYLEAKLKEKNS